MKSKMFVLAILAVVVIVLLFWALWPQAKAELIHGDIEVREIRLASKIPGRVAHIFVKEGQQVAKDDVLFELYSPELQAKLAQAKAAEAATQAMQDQTDSGMRSEEIDMVRLDWQRALVQQNLAEKTRQRMKNLHHDGLVALQQLDEVNAQWQASVDQASAAEARFTMAAQGARTEQREAVQAQNRQAAAAVAEVEAYYQETRILAPRAGEIASIVIAEGELAPSGFPVITLIDPTDNWVIFHLREDKLNALVPGTRFHASVPAIGQQLEFEVSKLAALPSFANWKQVRGTPGYDLKTFQLEARPVRPDPRLRAGMTVILALDN